MTRQPLARSLLTSRRLILALVAAAIVVLVVIIILLTFGKCCETSPILTAFTGSEGRLVLFQPRDDVGPDPFIGPAEREETTGRPPSPVTPGTGLYGGSLEQTCDVEMMIEYLLAHPDKGQAWAAVIGISYAELPDFLRSLTPTVLLVDTPVTNHGYKNGMAKPWSAILEAGTAVLMNPDGTVGAQCFCGNPLIFTHDTPTPPECTVVRETTLYSDWGIRDALLRQVLPGDGLFVLEFANDAQGKLGAHVRLDDGTLGWIDATALSERCRCVVAADTDVFDGWGAGSVQIRRIAAPAVVTIKNFSVDNYLGFGVEVEFEDGSTGWLEASSLVGPTPATASFGDLSKQALSSSPVKSGSLIDWATTLNQADIPVGATVVDHLGPGTSYVPGSAAGPAGWTADDTVPGQVTWTYQGAPTQPTSTSSVLEAPVVTVINTLAGASIKRDGLMPIYWNGRIYLTHHHQEVNAPSFACYEIATGATCPTFPKSMPDGDKNNPATVPVAQFPENVQVVGSHFLIYPATHMIGTSNVPLDWGLACYDLMTDLECGFTQTGSNNPQIITSTDSYLNYPNGALEGPWVVNNRAYVLDRLARLSCVDISSIPVFASCGSQYPVDLSSKLGTPPIGGLQNVGVSGQLDGTLLYIGTGYPVAGPPPSNPGVYCVDVTTGAACPGWTNLIPMTEDVGLLLTRDQNLVAKELCRAGQCLDLSSLTPTTSAAYDFLRLDLNGVPNTQVGHEVEVDSQVWAPVRGTDTVRCWDWTTSAACAGFGGNVGGITAPVGPTKQYGLGIQSDDCFWSYGDLGILWSFNPTNGSPQCAAVDDSGAGSAAGRLTPDVPPSCASDRPTWTWDKITAAGLNPAEWTSVELVLTDGSGTVVRTDDLLASQTIDLSALGASPTTLNYVVTGVPAASASPEPVTIELSYRPLEAPLQFCVKTTVEATSCHQLVPVLNGVTYSPDGRDVTLSAIAGVSVVPTTPREGCTLCQGASPGPSPTPGPSVSGGPSAAPSASVAAPTSSPLLTPGPSASAAAPDLRISKDTRGSLTYGEVASYRIEVRNRQDAGTATQPITVTDTLPPGSLAGWSGAGWTCTDAIAGVVTCTYGADLAPGESAPPLQIDVLLAEQGDWPAGSETAVNCAQVSHPFDVNADNNQSCVEDSLQATPTEVPPRTEPPRTEPPPPTEEPIPTQGPTPTPTR